jgi:hypothetical protein
MRRFLRRALAAAAIAFLGASLLYADEVLELKDGRKIQVTRLTRRDGQVIFQTTRGEVFSVPESQVVSPPLESIPPYEGQILVLKDGRRIPVKRLVRRGGQVLFETIKGERFSVSEEQVVSPPLESIPTAEAPETPSPPKAPTPTPKPPAPSPPPAPPPVETPPPPAPPAAPPTPGVPIDSLDDFVPLPDRWSIELPDHPRIVKGRLVDPYNQNVLKGDKPVIGDRTFLVLTGTVDAPNELRRLPIGSGVSTANPNELEFFGNGRQFFTTPRFFLSAEVFNGQTGFRPKSWALKATGAFNLNYLRLEELNNVDVDVREGKTRYRQHGSLEEAFAEVKLADVSPNYDFVSVRAGIQPFVSDFRGLVFSEQQLGARVFGNFANNRWSYNGTFFDLLERETNSELLTFERREQKVGVANVFRQDTLALGHTLSLSYHFSKDDASTHYDSNGFLVRPAKVGSVRPHEVKAHYGGLAGDGHFGRYNVSYAAYQVFGEDTDNPIEGRALDLNAQLVAAELSYDRDWARFKLTGFFASGDDDPADGKGKGFDSIYDNSNFGGGPFSFWSRSGIPLTQTGVLLKTPGSLLPSLRSNKFEGQGSYVNPGVLLLGFAVDLEVTPKIKAVLNANYLRFHKTGSLEYLLFQPGIHKEIGFDLGAGFLYRPLLNENIVFVGGVTGLVSGKGFDDIFSSACNAPGCGAEPKNLMNIFLNLKLTY